MLYVCVDLFMPLQWPRKKYIDRIFISPTVCALHARLYVDRFIFEIYSNAWVSRKKKTSRLHFIVYFTLCILYYSIYIRYISV